MSFSIYLHGNLSVSQHKEFRSLSGAECYKQKINSLSFKNYGQEEKKINYSSNKLNLYSKTL